MSAYENLAWSYDALTYDVPYEKILGFVEAIAGRRGVQGRSVLDLACGTGSLSRLLAEAGYQVTGVDCSTEMLTVASEKTMDLEENRPFFACQTMQHLHLPYQVDLAVCCLDSMNYVTDPEDCREAIRRVYQSLVSPGLFVFDINTPEKLQGLDGQVFLDETEDAYCVWRTEFSREERICYYGIDLFQREGKLWSRSFEEHREYAYTLEQLTEYLRQAGFTNIEIYGDCRLEPAQPGEGRVFFAASKE